MSEEREWSEFRALVKSGTKEYGEDEALVLAFGLASKLTEVYEVSQIEIVRKSDLNVSRLKSIKKVLWYVAAMENYFELPDSPGTVYFGKGSTARRGFEDINILELMADSLEHAAEISASIASYDIDSLQFHLNGVLIDMADTVASYNIDVSTALDFSKKNTQAKDETEDKVNVYAEAKKSSSKSIKESGDREILFDIKLDRRSKDPYVGVSIATKGLSKLFKDGDIITDFFTATNFCANTYDRKEYTHNYGEEFRAVLNERSDEVFMGFLYNSGVISAIDAKTMVTASLSNGNTVDIGENGRPIVMTHSIKTVDDLLDHVNAVRAHHKKK